MAVLTRTDILAAKDMVTEVVPVPEWGGDVIVRGLTGAERDDLESTIIQQHQRNTKINLHNLRAKMAAKSIVDEQGKRLFADQDIEALSAKSAVALQRVFNVAQRLAGMSADDVEELTKNSVSAPSGDSGSDSQ